MSPVKKKDEQKLIFFLGRPQGSKYNFLQSVELPNDHLANASNPLFYTAISTAGAAGMLYVIARYFKQGSFGLKKNWRSLTGIGLLQGSAYATFIVALSLGPVAYVNATKSSGVLFGALAGVLFLKESFTRTTLIAFILIAAGLGVLALQ